MAVILRHPKPDETDPIRALVQAVVDETYGGLWALPPLSIGTEDWSLAWLAICDARIAGMVLTHEEWIGDLWVLAEYRGQGLGRQLLFRGEAEIAARGHRTCRLRVVKSNTNAVAFYRRMNWSVEREFPHETLPITMLEMIKTV